MSEPREGIVVDQRSTETREAEAAIAVALSRSARAHLWFAVPEDEATARAVGLALAAEQAHENEVAFWRTCVLCAYFRPKFPHGAWGDFLSALKMDEDTARVAVRWFAEAADDPDMRRLGSSKAKSWLALPADVRDSYRTGGPLPDGAAPKDEILRMSLRELRETVRSQKAQNERGVRQNGDLRKENDKLRDDLEEEKNAKIAAKNRATRAERIAGAFLTVHAAISELAERLADHAGTDPVGTASLFNGLTHALDACRDKWPEALCVAHNTFEEPVLADGVRYGGDE